jgi:hypothetical protein
MKEVAVLPLWTTIPEKLTTDSCTPFLHWTELTGELSHGVPASVEDLISFAAFLFT